jgi:MscS family membrane protein
MIDINSLFNLISSNKYVRSAIILFVFFFIAKSLAIIVEKIILKLTMKTKTEVDDLIVKKTNKPISLILLLMGIRLAIVPIGFIESAYTIIANILYSLMIFIGGYIIITIIDVIVNNWGKTFTKRTKSEIDDTILSLIHKTIELVIYIIAILIILDNWGIKIGPLLASLGIAGLAIAFALQNTLANIFGGVSLILDKSIKIGDIVKLDADTMGTVYGIGIRSTKIKTWDNEIIIIPNGKLVESKIQNISQPDPSIRINIEFGVEYGSNIEKVKKVALDTINKIKEVSKEPVPKILFLAMADSSLNFKLMFWVDDISKKWDVHQEAITNLYNNLRKNKIGIPFPQMDVHLKKK